MKKIFITLVALNIIGISTFTLQASEERGRKHHANADKDKDGNVSKEEWKNYYKSMAVERMDMLWELSNADKDDFLTLEEWRKGRHEYHKKIGAEKREKEESN